MQVMSQAWIAKRITEHKFFQDFIDHLEEIIENAIEWRRKSISTYYEFGDGSYIDVEYGSGVKTSIRGYHADGTEKKLSDTMFVLLYNCIPSFGEVEEKMNDDCDEWQSHGFRDEADYLHYRFG